MAEEFLEAADGKTSQHPRSFGDLIGDVIKQLKLGFKKGVQLVKICAANIPMGAAGFCCQHGLVGQGDVEEFHYRMAGTAIQSYVWLDENLRYCRVSVVTI